MNSKSNQQLKAEFARVMRLAPFQDAHDVQETLRQYVAELMKKLERKPRLLVG